MNKRNKLNRIDPLRITPESLSTVAVDGGVSIIGICTLTDAMYGKGWKNQPDWDQQCVDLKAWSAKYNVSYYADCRENFFLFKGVEKALAEGNSFLVVEDMS